MAHSLENARVMRLLNDRAAARTRKEALAAGDGLPVLTPARIALSCAEHEGFNTPELNDRLYLHFGGYRKIENLEPYIACKALWLDSNAITTIEGISQMRDLRCLYLQQNAISTVGPGLSGLSKLQTLDLSSNRITHIEGLDCLPLLSTLIISKNLISTSDALLHLQGCLQLTNLDVSDNSLVGDITLPPRDSPGYALAFEKASEATAAATAAETAVKAAEANAKAILSERRKKVSPPPQSSAASISNRDQVEGEEIQVGNDNDNTGNVNEQDDEEEEEEEDSTTSKEKKMEEDKEEEEDEEFISRAVSSVALVPPTAPFSKGSLVDVLSKIPKLVTLYLKGNSCVRDTKHYRKTTVSSLPGLRYLDERPVFDAERFSTSAWAAGGLEAERAAIRKLEENKRNANKSQIERFAEWQKEVRAKRSKELEDHNASLRASGAPEVTELPRRSYVSYQRVSTKFQTETLRLQRLSDRAEKMAKANGLHETAMMDLGREWWVEEGVLDLDGNLVNRYPDDGANSSASSSSSSSTSATAGGAKTSTEDSQLPVRSALTTEKGEEEEERLVMEEVLKLERKERARLRAAARRVDGGPTEDEDEDELFNSGSSLITSVNAPSSSAAAFSESSSRISTNAEAIDNISNEDAVGTSINKEPQVMPTASEIRIKRSLEIFNERRRLAQLAEKKEEAAEEEEEEEDGKEARKVEKDKAKEFAKTREDFLSRLADARKEAEAMSAHLPVKETLEIVTPQIAAAPQSVPSTLTNTAQLSLASLSASSEIWSPQMDAALTKLVSAANFDFSRAARGLKSALLRGLLKAGGSGSPQAVSELLDEELCRLRFTAITTSTSGKAVKDATVSSSSSAEVAETEKSSLSLVSTAVSNTTSASSASISTVKVIRAGSGVGSSRAPMLLNTKSESTAIQVQQAVPSSSPLLSIALQGRVKPVSDLLGDKFEIKEFKDYVRVESLPSACSLVEAKEDDGGGDEEEEEEEAVVLNSKDIMEQLKRKGRK